MGDVKIVNEVPSSLKQLARLVVRGFYTVEDSILIDYLVRHPCVKEDDLCDLLRFEKKMLRARVATLKADKFLQERLRTETGPDGKQQRVHHYWINYKVFVNMVKYKLDHIRRKLETEERDATNRASFKCGQCNKQYTDLEADQLFDPMTGEFKCMFCGYILDEDDTSQDGTSGQDSRFLLSNFNNQMEPLYILLKEVESIQLAPELLDPEPISGIGQLISPGLNKPPPTREDGKQQGWTGEASRMSGMGEETRVQVQIGDSTDNRKEVKEIPTWWKNSTVTSAVAEVEEETPDVIIETVASSQDIASLLLAHEKPAVSAPITPHIAGEGMPSVTEGSDSDPEVINQHSSVLLGGEGEDVTIIESDDDEDDAETTVNVAGTPIPISEIDDELITRMTPEEKDHYIEVYQDLYSHMDDT